MVEKKDDSLLSLKFFFLDYSYSPIKTRDSLKFKGYHAYIYYKPYCILIQKDTLTVNVTNLKIQILENIME